MFYSVYSRADKRGDGVGGYITYVSGDNTVINSHTSLIDQNMVFEAVELLIDSGYKVVMRTNQFHEMLEVSITRATPRWQDGQVLQVVGSSPLVCLCDLLVLFYLFFSGEGDWVEISQELEGQELDPVSPVFKNLPPNLLSSQEQVELPTSRKKGGKNTNVPKDEIVF